MGNLVPVRVRDCACPDGLHSDPELGDGDFVYIVPKVTLELGIAADQALVAAGGDTNVLTRLWLDVFVRFGAKAANFIDPFNVQELLDDWELGGPVSDAANDLYAETLLRPLGLSPSKPSRGGRTGGSTSRTKRSPTRSRGSSSAPASAGLP